VLLLGEKGAKLLVFKVDAFHTRGNAGENFVGDGAAEGSKFRGGECFAKDGGEVAFFTRNVCDINHADVHTDITYVISFPTINKAIAFPVAKESVQAVCIADRQACNTAVTCQYCPATIAYTLSSLNVMYL